MVHCFPVFLRFVVCGVLETIPRLAWMPASAYCWLWCGEDSDGTSRVHRTDRHFPWLDIEVHTCTFVRKLWETVSLRRFTTDEILFCFRNSICDTGPTAWALCTPYPFTHQCRSAVAFCFGITWSSLLLLRISALLVLYVHMHLSDEMAWPGCLGGIIRI